MKIQITTGILAWMAVLATCFFLVVFAYSAFNSMYNHIIGDSKAAVWQSR